MEKLQFGWAEVDITPTQKIALAGEFFERVTNEVETPITVTALAIKSGNEQAVICSCDVVSIGIYVMEKVREKLTNPEIDKSKLIVAAIHTHNSYTMPRFNPDSDYERGGVNRVREAMPSTAIYHPQVTSDEAMDPDDALEFVSGKIAEAIETAWANLSEGGYKATFGRVAVGMNRRVCFADGTAKMWGDVDNASFTTLEAGNDSGMEMLFIYDKNDEMTGIVANIACPAQVMEQRSVISGDYWAKVKLLMREKYGKDFKILGLCAPAGDQCPRDLIRWVEPETPILDPNVIRNDPKLRNADPSMFDIKGTWRIGKRIVNEMELILEETQDRPIVKEAAFTHNSLKLHLPLRRVTDLEKTEAERAMKDFFRDKTEIDYMDTAELYVHAGTLTRYEYQKNHNMVEIEVNVLRLGNIAFATNPFELFVDYGNAIRARSAAEQTFLVQLSNGCYGYLPTENAEKHGHYSAYVSSGSIGHEGGDLLVRETLEEIKKLF